MQKARMIVAGAKKVLKSVFFVVVFFNLLQMKATKRAYQIRAACKRSVKQSFEQSFPQSFTQMMVCGRVGKPIVELT